VTVPRTDPKAAEFVAQGDAHLQESHLYGWRRAEACYKNAFALDQTDEIKSRLRLVRLLMLARQSDEDIPDPAMDETVTFLCTDAATERDRALCEIAQWYQRESRAGQEGATSADLAEQAVFNAEDSALDAYLHLLSVRAHGLEDPHENWAALENKFKDSPLFIYLGLGRRGARGAAELENTLPEFAELFEFTGDSLFQKQKYGSARTCFKNAIDLIPDYTRALNGLGNMYLFALEDPEKALQYYDTSLEWDPANTPALFGKGTALHQLGKFAESDAVLDQMLRGELSRKGRASAAGARYYQGEAYFLKANNQNLSRNPAKAREFVDKARTFLPDSEEINYLSGLLYFEGKDMEAARADFLRVMVRGASNCEAQFHLGLIYLQMKGEVEDQQVAAPLPGGGSDAELTEYLRELPEEKEPVGKKALGYFLGAASCMRTGARNLVNVIDSVPSLDLQPAEKVILKGKLERKLLDHRMSSTSRIETMINALSNREIAGKEAYVKLLSEILESIRIPVGSM
jgi:tetratricopeptide (TPR) repeat protein